MGRSLGYLAHESYALKFLSAVHLLFLVKRREGGAGMICVRRFEGIPVLVTNFTKGGERQAQLILRAGLAPCWSSFNHVCKNEEDAEAGVIVW